MKNDLHAEDSELETKLNAALSRLDEIRRTSTNKHAIIDGLKKRKKEFARMLKSGVAKKQIIEALKESGISVNLRDLSSILGASRKSKPDVIEPVMSKPRKRKSTPKEEAIGEEGAKCD